MSHHNFNDYFKFYFNLKKRSECATCTNINACTSCKNGFELNANLLQCECDYTRGGVIDGIYCKFFCSDGKYKNMV